MPETPFFPAWRAPTLLDAQLYPAEEILRAYLRRWRLEMCLDDLKTSLRMEMLRSRSPDLVRKEILAGLIAHNLVRWTAAQVKVFYTGLATQVALVNVRAGDTAAHDFSLAGFEPAAADSDTPVKLDQFVVSTSREMDGAAIAINEKRFAADIRNVIAADEFGPMADGNVGEILKTVPGVALDYVGGAAMNISLNGVPSGYVPVEMNGFPLASTTASAPTGRDVELINVATNNLSRIDFVQANWRGVSAPTNGTTLPHTTADQPYLTNYLIRDQPRQSRRSSAGLTLDYKLSRTDRISISLQATRFDAQYNQRDLTFAITRVLPGNFSTSHTHGDRGGGTLTLLSANDRDRRNSSFSPSIIYRHDGPI
jgi:hypothetical protein